MPNAPLKTVLRHVRRLAAKQNAETDADDALLKRFVSSCDEGAFEAILARHGSMVLNVCQRVLHDPHAAEDAFQATFLVLVRKARSIGQGELLCNWLYGVACRTAQRAKVERAKRQCRESAAPSKQPADCLADITVRELFAALDGELQRMSSPYRAPLVLCYLQGKTRDEAARQLGWSLSTLDRRLNRAREILRTRLFRRGVTLSVVMFPILLLQSSASASMSSSLLAATTKAGSAFAAGQALNSGTVSADVVALTEGVLKAMFLTKLKTFVVVLLSLGALGFGVGAGSLTSPSGPTAVGAEKPTSQLAGAGPAAKVQQMLELGKKVEGKLTDDDPKYQSRQKSEQGQGKLYTCKLEAGKVYVFDMQSSAFPPLVRLEDESGKVIRFSDKRESACMFKPSRDGIYRIIAMTEDGKTGNFTLMFQIGSGAGAAWFEIKRDTLKRNQESKERRANAKTQEEKDRAIAADLEATVVYVRWYTKFIEDYPNDPRAKDAQLYLRGCLGNLGFTGSPWAAQQLRTFLEKGSTEQTRAQAGLSLGVNLQRQSEKAFVNDKRKAEALRKEAEGVFAMVQEKFGQVDGLGEKIDDILFRFRNLSTGKVAPDIEGEDTDGKKFKLSDYRGKVVLDFWGHW
jgi:RNA polymerase sigma factor (sigma-70 family)